MKLTVSALKKQEAGYTEIPENIYQTELKVQKAEREKYFRCYSWMLVGFTLSQATKALRESRGIALLYF